MAASKRFMTAQPTVAPGPSSHHGRSSRERITAMRWDVILPLLLGSGLTLLAQ